MSLLIKVHREPLHRLEQCREQKAHGSSADDALVASQAGSRGLWNQMSRQSQVPCKECLQMLSSVQGAAADITAALASASFG